MLRASLLLLLAFSPRARAEGSGLEGTRWTVRRADLLHALAFFWTSDSFEFSGGRFLSSAALKRGFGAARFVGADTWSAVQLNDAGEKLEWQGTRRGDRMTGTVTLTAGARKRLYRWKAKLRGARAAPAAPAEASPGSP